MSDVNHPAFWEDIYSSGRAGWDLGTPTPVFQRLLSEGAVPPGRVIVLGAGRGHDAREFARRGFEVIAVDFAADAVEAMRAALTPVAHHEILHHDLFQLPSGLDATFDVVLEYTCYCAIDPSRRAEYADVVARLLKPGGHYVALAFPLNAHTGVDAHAGGPPFAVSAQELIDLLTARGLELVRREMPRDSIKPRRGREELIIMQRAVPISNSC